MTAPPDQCAGEGRNWGGEHLTWCILLITAVIAVHALPFASYRSPDADIYLIPWYNHIVALGPFKAFSQPFSNYTPPYLYLLTAASLLGRGLDPLLVIKLLAAVGAVWLAVTVGLLLRLLQVKTAAEGAIATLILPSIVLNVSLLGQADIFWVACCVLAFGGAVRDRMGAVAFWSGVAFALKAQAIFFAPFVVQLFIVKRARWSCGAALPVIYCVAMIPAWLEGWPAWHLLSVYFRQAEWQPVTGAIFVSNGASWWTVYGWLFPKLAIRTFWIGYLTTAIAVLAYVLLLIKRRLAPRQMIAAAALSGTIVPFLLPGMHERFFILADILCFCLAWIDPNRRTIATAFMMQVASSLPGYSWAFSLYQPRLAACFFSLAAILLLIDYLSPAPKRSLVLAST